MSEPEKAEGELVYRPTSRRTDYSKPSLVIAVIALALALIGSVAFPGPAGPEGAPGAQGAQGPQGLQGNDGPQGPSGADGADGADGIACWDLDGDGIGDIPAEDRNADSVVDVNDCTGAQGPVGPQGPQGDSGPQGIQGPQGDPGPQGQAGPAGINGTNGFHCWDLNMNGVADLPAEDTNGDLIVDVNDCTGPQGPQGNPGPQGPAGPQGPPGMGVGRPVFSRTVLDTGGVGIYASVAIGVDGLALISYFDEFNFDLKVAHCSDIACTAATITAIDTMGDVGEYTSITIGADGLGLISYYDSGNGDLKVAHCSDVACTTATISTLDSVGDVGEHTSITIGVDGLGLISYYDITNGDLKVAHCSDVACTTATLSTIDYGGESGNDDVGWYTSITISSRGGGLISYYDVSNGSLMVAVCHFLNCTSASLFRVDYYPNVNVGWHTSITIGPDGNPLISYYDVTNWTLKVAHCPHHSCFPSVINPYTVSTLNMFIEIAGMYTSATTGVDGRGLISYYDLANGDLKVAHCEDLDCTSAILITLDSVGTVGWYTSITIGVDGFGLIAYHDATNGSLKVAHLSNIFGQPYVQYR